MGVCTRAGRGRARSASAHGPDEAEHAHGPDEAEHAHGPDEAGPGVRVLSGLSAGAGRLSEAGPVRVVRVERPGGPEHRGRFSHAKNEHAMWVGKGCQQEERRWQGFEIFEDDPLNPGGVFSIGGALRSSSELKQSAE